MSAPVRNIGDDVKRGTTSEAKEPVWLSCTSRHCTVFLFSNPLLVTMFLPLAPSELRGEDWVWSSIGFPLTSRKRSTLNDSLFKKEIKVHFKWNQTFCSQETNNRDRTVGIILCVTDAVPREPSGACNLLCNQNWLGFTFLLLDMGWLGL